MTMLNTELNEQKIDLKTGIQMDINRHIVDQRIRKIVLDNPDWFIAEGDDNKKITKAFVILSVSAYMGIELSEAYSLLTEGRNDAGIDAISIGDTVNFEFQVTIFQAKYKFDLDNDANYPANSVLRVVNAVASIFDPSKDVMMNESLRPKVEEIRSLIADGYIPAVKCVIVNNGLRWNNEGDQHIANANFPQNQVVFEHFNHQNIVDQLKTIEKINEVLSLSGKGIVEEFNFKRVLIGKINVGEIASLMDRYGDSLLERNVRKFLGLRINRVNESIKNTLISPDKKNNFYLFNNGITIVCNNFRYNALSSENWQVKVEDMQIINGGQTCKTIQQTINDNPGLDFSNVFVLVRLYEISEGDDELLTDITIATNSQNPVNLRDLRANESIQRDLEAAVKELGYVYKRKRDNITSGDSIPSSVAAEAVFAVWKKSPHLAKFRRSELFGKFYYDVFQNLNAAQLVIAVLIYRYCDSQRKKARLIEAYPHISYSNYFLSMLVGQQLLRELNTEVKNLTHKNFDIARDTFEKEKDMLYERANQELIRALNELYKEGYERVELRRLSATFRRGDLLQVLGME